MEIKTVSIIGLGALGILFASQLAEQMEPGTLRIVADEQRIRRYQAEGVFCNDAPCSFSYITPETPCTPADLVLVCVKFGTLPEAITDLKYHVGPQTTILSALNGISSEEILGEAFGRDQVLFSVAQGMDAVKFKNRLSYTRKGMLCFGDRAAGSHSDRSLAVQAFFDRVKFPYELVADMYQRMWSKFMLNVGVNQTVAIYEGTYRTVQQEGKPRQDMIAAMKEVIALAPYEGVTLDQSDILYWLDILDTLGADGMPSMRQDLAAGYKSEVELFSGTVIRLGRKYQVPTPVNQMLYDRICEMEAGFGQRS